MYCWLNPEASANCSWVRPLLSLSRLTFRPPVCACPCTETSGLHTRSLSTIVCRMDWIERAVSKHKSLVFEGAGGRYEVSAEQWAEMLRFLNNWGWRPEATSDIVFGDRGVSLDGDSRNLAATGQHVLDTALKEPAAVYPVSFDMAKFYLLVEFCQRRRISTKRVDERIGSARHRSRDC